MGHELQILSLTDLKIISFLIMAENSIKKKKRKRHKFLQSEIIKKKNPQEYIYAQRKYLKKKRFFLVCVLFLLNIF